VAERVPSGTVEARARPSRRRSDLWLAAAATISCNFIAPALVYRPTPKPKFFAQINNLLDRRYDTAAQIGTVADCSVAPAPWLRSPGAGLRDASSRGFEWIEMMRC
jgi:hypothetical protein